MLAFASVTCTAVVLLAGDRGVERTPFAIPAAVSAQSPWNDEVSRFAQRLHKALGHPPCDRHRVFGLDPRGLQAPGSLA